MDRLKCIIIDDELNCVQSLSKLIKKIPQLELVGIFTDPLDALAFLRKNEVYLVFLDISMGTLSGLDLAILIENKIIFTTGHQEFALKSYEFSNVVDYLMKPIYYDRLSKSIKKASSQFIIDNIPPQEIMEGYLVFKHNGATIKIDHDSISYIRASANYSMVHYENKKIIVPIPIWDMENILPTNKFIRINKSHIANMDQIVEENGKELQLLGGHTLKLGKSYFEKRKETQS